MKDCIFCKIAKGEIPCKKIYEDADIISFMDIKPVNQGHLLVIPKQHYRWMYDTPDEIIAKVFSKAKELMKSLKESLNADYVVISVEGMDVPHFHAHIIPRNSHDGVTETWTRKDYKDGEMDEIYRKIMSDIK